MNFGPLRIGQSLLWTFTTGKAGLIGWWPPGPNFNSTGLTTGLPGPCLSALPPCDGKPTFGCARFGLSFWAFGLARLRLGLTACRFWLVLCGRVIFGPRWTGLLVCT